MNLPAQMDGTSAARDIIEAAQRSSAAEHMMDRLIEACTVCGRTRREIVEHRLRCSGGQPAWVSNG